MTGTRIPSRGLCLAVALLILNPVSAQESRNKLPKQQHKTSNAPFLKPKEAVAKMDIPDDFEVSIFASEPDIGEPIAFTFDDRGRLWVVEWMCNVSKVSNGIKRYLCCSWVHVDVPLNRTY